MADKFEIEILEDGTIKITTDKVSAANHTNADGLIRELIKEAGGVAERTKRGGHIHEHEHDGIVHSH
jgi:hypothetical protein